jgi:hypothetical protein
MKKNRIILILTLFILIVGITGFATYNTSEDITVKVSIFDLSAQLSNLQSWPKWNHLIRLNGQSSLKLTVVNPALFQLQDPQNGNDITQVIAIYPTDINGFTKINWVVQKSGFSWLAEKISGKNEIRFQLNSLKKFAESTQGRYGFLITLSKTTDHLICIKKRIVPPGNVQPYVAALLGDVYHFLKLNKIPVAGNYYYVSSSLLIDQKTELVVGLPVKSSSSPKDSVEFLTLPANAYLVVGSLHGNAENEQQLYIAMDKYLMDNGLHKLAQPMEKYTDNSQNISNQSNIDMQIIYPVY